MKLQNKKDIIYKFQIAGASLLMLALICLIGILLVYQKNMKEPDKDEVVYKRHYLFIEQDRTNSLTNQLFQEAQKYAKEKGVYVERLENVSFSDYTTEDYLKMAIAMNVNGIILEGCDSLNVQQMVNQAVDAGIPVVTVLTDCKDSKRQCFIDLGTYNLGREYGRWIIETAKREDLKAMLLADNGADSSGQNLIYTGIMEILNSRGRHLNVQLETERLDTSSQFSAAVRIWEILVDEGIRPDVIICTTEQETEAVYQALVDHYLVGEVTVLGYCVSDIILKAIQNEGIAATINVDTKQMGQHCVDVLDDYIESGHVSNYVMADMDVVTKENVEGYLENEEAK